MSAHDDFEVEPVRGLPELLPAHEAMLWQGAPDWRVLARRAFAARACAGYFAALAIWRGWVAWTDGGSAAEIASAATWLIALGAVAVGLLCLMAWLAARNTVYSITSKRVVLRIGFMLTITVNLPHRWIGAAELKLHADGSGDIALRLTGATRLAYLMLWPSVRPWRLGRAEPALRAIPQARAVADILVDAMQLDLARRQAAASRPHRIAAE